MGFFKKHSQNILPAIFFVITAAILSCVLFVIEFLSQVSLNDTPSPIYVFLDSLPFGKTLDVVYLLLFNFLIASFLLWLFIQILLSLIYKETKLKKLKKQNTHEKT